MGYTGVHIDLVLYGLPHDGIHSPDGMAQQLGADSLTTYTWIHHISRRGFPTSDYESLCSRYFRSLEYGGESNGLKFPTGQWSVPYCPNVMMGWDSSPRCNPRKSWAQHRGYPNGSVVVNNTPKLFKHALQQAKDLAERTNAPAVTINAWNEWGEGSYLEPEQRTGMSYLQAVREVFAEAN